MHSERSVVTDTCASVAAAADRLRVWTVTAARGRQERPPTRLENRADAVPHRPPPSTDSGKQGSDDRGCGPPDLNQW